MEIAVALRQQSITRSLDVINHTLQPWLVCQRETFEILVKAIYRLMKAPKLELEALKL